jgi:hypothetical protein
MRQKSTLQLIRSLTLDYETDIMNLNEETADLIKELLTKHQQPSINNTVKDILDTSMGDLVTLLK